MISLCTQYTDFNHTSQYTKHIKRTLSHNSHIRHILMQRMYTPAKILYHPKQHTKSNIYQQHTRHTILYYYFKCYTPCTSTLAICYNHPLVPPPHRQRVIVKSLKYYNASVVHSTFLCHLILLSTKIQPLRNTSKYTLIPVDSFNTLL